MGGLYCTCGEEDILVGNLRERDRLEVLGIDGIIQLKFILKQ